MDYEEALEFRNRNGLFRIVHLALGDISFEEKHSIVPDFGISLFENMDYRVRNSSVDPVAKVVFFELDAKNLNGEYIKVSNYLVEKIK